MNIHPELFSTVKDLHAQTDPAHNFKHIEIVCAEVEIACKEFTFLTENQKLSLYLSGFLHELDDAKLKFTLPGVKNEGPYPLAKHLLNKYYPTEISELALECISLVSTRTNHNRVVEEKWKLIPRDADRLQAIGDVGLARCYIYTSTIGQPLFTDQTPRCMTIEDIYKVATPERFQAYRGHSESMISHYYDKLLHIQEVASGSSYLMKDLELKKLTMIDFILVFGQTGTLDEEFLNTLVQKYCY